MIKGSAICALAAITLFFVRWSFAALWPLALIPFVYLISAANYRNLGYTISERYFCSRRGWAGRSTHIVPINKIQAVEIHQSPLDRRLGLATLNVDTAGQAYTGGGPHISNLPMGEARAIANTLAHRASATRYNEGRGSRIGARGSRTEDRGSSIEDRGSRIEDRGSSIEDRGIEDRELKIEVEYRK
jgi:membrane protein YdbS with pleckstrin-like domain